MLMCDEILFIRNIITGSIMQCIRYLFYFVLFYFLTDKVCFYYYFAKLLGKQTLITVKKSTSRNNISAHLFLNKGVD